MKISKILGRPLNRVYRMDSWIGKIVLLFPNTENKDRTIFFSHKLAMREQRDD